MQTLTGVPSLSSVADRARPRVVCQVKAEGGATSSSSALTSEQLKTVPVRAYLDNTVVPLLMQGMSELVKVRYGSLRQSLRVRTLAL